MNKQFHILNGDALRERLPKSIDGEIIVARECLVDGEVKGDNLEELFATRAKFISQNYEGFSEQDYFNATVPEFRKMQEIPKGAEINLWFEDDLFCQVNFWFVVHLLHHAQKPENIFLIRPKAHSPYSFGHLDEQELVSCYENKLQLTNLETLSQLWTFYQTQNTAQLLQTAQKLQPKYPFLLPAIEAHIDQLPNPEKGTLGRPKETLLQIIEELQTEKFGLIFKEFLKREGIYGFGDLQVKRLLEGIKNAP